MKIFISGSKGFVASNLIPYLEAKHHEVIGFDLEDGDDLLDAPVVIEASRFSDAIIHLGAIARIPYCEKHPQQAVNVNIMGTMNVAQAAHLHKIPLVFASTFAAENPRSVYGLTKRLGEKMVLRAGGVVLRLANVYGGKGYLDKTTAMANFVKIKDSGGKATIYGDGSAERDFIEISDVCRAFIAALNAESGIYRICTWKLTTIRELVDLIGVEYNLAPQREKPPITDKLLKGWKPEVSLREGLKQFVREGS